MHPTIISLAFLIILLSCSSSKKIGEQQKKEAFIPLNTGNQWIYKDSVWVEKKLTNVRTDTVKVTGTRTINGQKWWKLSNGKIIRTENDSVWYAFVTHGGDYISHLQYFRLIEKKTFSTGIDSDIMIERTAEKLDKPVIIAGTKYEEAYKFTDHCGAYTLIAPGTGIIEEVKTDCFAPRPFRKKRSLIEFILKK